MRKRILLAAAIGLLLGAIGVQPAAGQEVTADWAAPLMGSWAVELTTPDGQLPLVVTVREDAGNVVVVLGNQDGESDPITRLSRTDDTLVARYDIDYQGMPINAVLRMQRQGDELNTRWSFADGMYETSAQGTRRE